MEYIKIGNIAKSIVSGGTPKSTKAEYYNGNIPWLNTKEINFNRIYSTEKCITAEGLNNSSAKYIKENCVIIAMYGATAGRAAINKISLTTNQACCNIEVDSSKMDYNYVYYAIKNDYEHLSSLANGGAQQNLNSLIIKDFEIPYVNLYIQKKISKILTSIDKKIELNNEINNNLHDLCNNLYFKLVSQLNDTNSSVESIKNVAKCVLGGTPSRTKKEYWNGSINWINSGEINKFRIIKASEKITELGLNKSSTTLLPRGTTVLAITGATLGQVSRLEIDSCANQSVIGIITNKKELNNYMYLSILNSINDLVLKQTGGAQQHINKNDVETHEIIVPSTELISQFDEIIRPLFDQISVNCFEINKLEQLRDTLLPKLMNGEIDLDNIEI